MQTKLNLKKQTISRLSGEELKEIKAALDQDACWENLWTVYNCHAIYTCSEPA